LHLFQQHFNKTTFKIIFMKNLFKTFALTLLASATFSSCETDPCKDVVCGDFGQCVEGTCVCNTGYEADAAGLCNTLQRAKFLGSFAVSDSCSNSGTASYTCPITANTGDISTVNITNFWGTFTNAVTATVSGNTITIARQQPDNDNFYVVGTGTISGTVITFSYTITNETDPNAIVTDNCNNVTWTKI
jgi:hypothetical protein